MPATEAGTPLVIDVLQYILCRVQADVDDLLCNSLGAMLGYCLSLLFVSLAKKLKNRGCDTRRREQLLT